MTNEHISVDVVITGAGMVGLTLANLLCKQDKSIAMIDRNKITPYKQDEECSARVTAVSPGSQAIFEHVNAWSVMQAKRVTPFQHMHVWDEANGTANHGSIHFDAAELQRSDLGHIVENRVIQTSLCEVLQSKANVQWLMPAVLKEIFHHQDYIEIRLDNGQEIKTKLLIGADGGRSAVRNLAGIGYTEKSYQQLGLVALVETEHPHQNTAWQRFLQTGPLALLPVNCTNESQKMCSIVWSVSEDYADDLMKLDEHEFADALTAASDMQLGNIILCSKCAAFPLISGLAEKMVQPRLALVGDAAHALHPLAGQGANLGFTDAAVLADVLTKSDRDIGSYKVLRKYERARVGETQVMQKVMDVFVSGFGSNHAAVITTRNYALSTVDRMHAVKKFFMTHAMGLNRDRPSYAR